MWHDLWVKFTAHLDWWAIFGFVFQAAFMGRFLVQWIASERQKESVIPISFWYLSLIGSTGVLIYAIGRGDVVIILGQLFGTVVYVRNLMLIYRGHREQPAALADPRPPADAS
jgi:lipid-A-disaccharide synthase-like uncharacterized protein